MAEEEEEVYGIKLTQEQVIEIQSSWTTLKATRELAHRKSRELALAKAEREAASIRFWAVLEGLYPELIEGGNWKYNEDTETIERRDDDEGPRSLLLGPFNPMQ